MYINIYKNVFKMDIILRKNTANLSNLIKKNKKQKKLKINNIYKE